MNEWDDFRTLFKLENDIGHENNFWPPFLDLIDWGLPGIPSWDKFKSSKPSWGPLASDATAAADDSKPQFKWNVQKKLF